MSVRVATSSLISGAVVLGNRGLGVLGSAVPSSGDDGAGYLYNDLSLPADAGKEVRGLITAPPSGLTSFFAYEDSSFTASGPDGAYPFTYRLFVDGADLGTATVTINIGAVSSTVTAAPGAATVSAAGASVAAAVVGAAAGAATVSAVGSSGAVGTASAVAAQGAAVVSAVGAGVAAATATAAAGAAAVSAVGGSTVGGQAAVVAAAGVATVSAVGSSVAASAVVPAAGTATVVASVGVVSLTGRVVTTTVPNERRVTSMGTAQVVDDLDVEEADTLKFDFSAELTAAGATISSAAVEVDVREGHDPVPSDLLDGALSIVNSATGVTQRVDPDRAPVGYGIRCVAQCSDGLPRVAVALLNVRRM